MYKLKEFRKQFGLTQNDVAGLFNCGQSNIVSIERDGRDLTPEQLNILIKEYGEDKTMMFQEEGSDGDTDIYVYLLPISAQGGSLNDFVVSVKESECEKIISPIKGVDWAITVAGDSMAPEYPSGSQILIKKINEKAFIDWGKVYVLDTCNGTVLKILVPSEKEGFVKCLSINTEPRYASFDVCFDDIYGVYRVMLCMSVK